MIGIDKIKFSKNNNSNEYLFNNCSCEVLLTHNN
jgi:hypothetical protein